MSHLIPKRSEQCVTFVLTGCHSLNDKSTAAGFRSGIPSGPPLNQQEYSEDVQGHPRIFRSKTWQESKGLVVAKALDYLRFQSIHSANMLDGNDRQQDAANHGGDELNDVCYCYSP